jgi:hypothetical protein
MQWASAYAEGGPDNRYSSKWSFGIWYSLLFVKVAAASTALKMLI